MPITVKSDYKKLSNLEKRYNFENAFNMKIAGYKESLAEINHKGNLLSSPTPLCNTMKKILHYLFDSFFQNIKI